MGNPFYFNSVAEMKSASLATGDFVITLGYYSCNDGGGGKYTIVSSANGESTAILINNGLKANLVIDNNVVSVKQFGAKGDCVRVSSIAVSIAASSNTLTVQGAKFSAGDVGKNIVIPGAGTAGVGLATTIAGYVGNEQVTLTDSASTILSSASMTIVYGTDDSDAIQAAINKASTLSNNITNSGIVEFNSLNYLVSAKQMHQSGWVTWKNVNCGMILKSNVQMNMIGSTISLLANSLNLTKIIIAQDVESIKIFGGELIGDRDSHTAGLGSLDTNTCGIDFYGIRDVLIDGTIVRETLGDGFAVMGGATFLNNVSFTSGSNTFKVPTDPQSVYNVRHIPVGSTSLSTNFPAGTTVIKNDLTTITMSVAATATVTKTISFKPPYPTNFVMKNCWADHCYRNNLTVNSDLFGCRFENCTFSNAVGANPQLGIDVEPLYTTPTDLVFDNITTYGNYSGGAVFQYAQYITVVNSRFDDGFSTKLCRNMLFNNNYSQSLGIAYSDIVATGNRFFNGSISITAGDSGVKYTGKNSMSILFTNNYLYYDSDFKSNGSILVFRKDYGSDVVKESFNEIIIKNNTFSVMSDNSIYAVIIGFTQSKYTELSDNTFNIKCSKINRSEPGGQVIDSFPGNYRSIISNNRFIIDTPAMGSWNTPVFAMKSYEKVEFINNYIEIKNYCTNHILRLDNAVNGIPPATFNVFNNIVRYSKVTGERQYGITTNFVANDTFTVEGYTLAAVASGAVDGQFNVGTTSSTTAANIVTALNANATISAKFFAYKVPDNGDNRIFVLVEKTPGGGNTPGIATTTGTGVVVNYDAINSTSGQAAVNFVSNLNVNGAPKMNIVGNEAVGTTNLISGSSGLNRNENNVISNRRTSAPTTGSWNVGDIIYNSAPAAGGSIGWICVATGTPGTWKEFGLISK